MLVDEKLPMTDLSANTPWEEIEPPAIAAVVRDADEWDRLESEWEELFNASPTASTPLHFQWLRQWWRVYGPIYGNQSRGLRILIVRRDSRLIGALPLYQSNTGLGLGIRRLRFLSQGEKEFEETCADYLDLLHLPGQERACLDAIRLLLMNRKALLWDELELDRLAASSPLLEWREHFPQPFRAAVTSRGDCYVSNLAGGFDAYMKRLSASTRKNARHLLNTTERVGADFQIASDPADAELFMQQLIDLHQQRWQSVGKPGCFASPRFTAFHRHLAKQWVAGGKAILARLSLAGEPLMVIYGALVGNKFDCFLTGTTSNEKTAMRSPGTAAHLLLKSHLAERGVIHYDYLLGNPSSYKKSFGTDTVPLVHFRIVRPGTRTAINAGTVFINRALRKSWNLLRKRKPSAATP